MRVISKTFSLPPTLVCVRRSPGLLRFIRTQAQYEYTPREDYNLSEFSRPAGLATPRQVIKYPYLREFLVHRPIASTVS
jgi:ATP-dependent Clp protease ATP-binding subunit ClpX